MKATETAHKPKEDERQDHDCNGSAALTCKRVNGNTANRAVLAGTLQTPLCVHNRQHMVADGGADDDLHTSQHQQLTVVGASTMFVKTCDACEDLRAAELLQCNQVAAY